MAKRRRRKIKTEVRPTEFLVGLLLLGAGVLLASWLLSGLPATPPAPVHNGIPSLLTANSGASDPGSTPRSYANLPVFPTGDAAVSSYTSEPTASAAAPGVPESDAAGRFVGKRWTIRGHKVPLRSAAQVGSPLVDRLETGQIVTVLETRDDWARIRTERTRREGWIPVRRIGGEAPVEAKKPEGRIAPLLTTAAIAKLLIAASIADYPSTCACPYQSARNGSSCGRRSAYSRPGGYAPLCYERDVTAEMVEQYRRTH